MGLFDQVLGNNQNAPITDREAYFGILSAAVFCDGGLENIEEVPEEELIPMAAAMVKTATWGHTTEEEMEQMGTKIGELVGRIGFEPALDVLIASLPSNLNSVVFAICADIVCADGRIDPAEASFMDSLHKKLQIPDLEAQNIVNVMICKNSA